MFFPSVASPVLSGDFDAANSAVDCGSNTSLDNLNPITIMAWVKQVSALAGGARVCGKGTSGTQELQFATQGTSGDVRIVRTRATTNLQYNTNTTPLAVSNRWHFLAAWFNTGASGNQAAIYHGHEAKPAVEQTYSLTQNGSGAINSDAAANLFLGATSATAAAWDGHIWCIGIVARQLSLPEIIDFQFAPKTMHGMVGMWFPGQHIGRVVDWSGNSNHGSPTSAMAVANGMPSFYMADWDNYGIPVFADAEAPQFPIVGGGVGAQFIGAA